MDIVAHSYGGVATAALLDEDMTSVSERVAHIAFTDSVHSSHGHSDATRAFLRARAINWVTSPEPVDTVLRPGMRSAGATRHEETSHYAFDAIFDFFSRSLSA